MNAEFVSFDLEKVNFWLSTWRLLRTTVSAVVQLWKPP